VPLATAEVDGAHARRDAARPQPGAARARGSRRLSAIAHALADSRHEVPGVHGAEAACAAFAEVWRERCGLMAAERVRLRHHVLDTVSPVPAPAGTMRVADAGDRDWLVEALDAFVDEARAPRAPQGSARMVEQRIADRRLRVWEDGGIVAFLGANLIDGGYARIGPVYTPKARRGYAIASSPRRQRADRARRPPRVPDDRRREPGVEFDLRSVSASGRSTTWSPSTSSHRERAPLRRRLRSIRRDARAPDEAA
jgi:hypothetical protein